MHIISVVFKYNDFSQWMVSMDHYKLTCTICCEFESLSASWASVEQQAAFSANTLSATSLLATDDRLCLLARDKNKQIFESRS